MPLLTNLSQIKEALSFKGKNLTNEKTYFRLNHG